MSTPERLRTASALACQPADRYPIGELYVDDGLVVALARLSGLPCLTGAEPRVGPALRQAVLERLHLDTVAAYPRLPSGEPLLGVHLAAGPGGWRPGNGSTAASRLCLPEPAALDWEPVVTCAKEASFYTVAVVPGPFGELAYLAGMEAFLTLTWRNPDAARRLAEAMVDYGIELARLARSNGADGFVVGDDIAWDRGLLLRPETYRALFLPALRREVEALHDLGAPVVFHTDGDATALLDDLADAGVDSLHGLSVSPTPSVSCAPDGSGRARGTVGSGRARGTASAGGGLGDQWGGRPPRCLSRWGNLDLDALVRSSPGGLADLVAGTFAAYGAASAGTAADGEEPGRGPSPGYVFGTSAGILDASLPPEAVQATFDHAHALAVSLGATVPDEPGTRR